MLTWVWQSAPVAIRVMTGRTSCIKIYYILYNIYIYIYIYSYIYVCICIYYIYIMLYVIDVEE